MRADIEQMKTAIEQSVDLLKRRLDWDVAERRLAELNNLAEDPTLWDDPQNAQNLMQERSKLENAFKAIEKIQSELVENVELAELAEMDEDAELLDAAAEALENTKKAADEAELLALMSGEADGNDCFVEIHPGAGGTEAQDWAEMVLRMYMRWANSRGMKTELLEAQDGDGAGIKSATLRIKGENAFGWMKTERELLIFEQHLYLRQPGYGTSYITGKYLLEAALAEYARINEEDFKLQHFFDKLNSMGNIPIALGRWEMTGVDDEIRNIGQN